MRARPVPIPSFLALALAIAATPAEAALPPHYQRQAEFEAVLRAAVETFGIAAPIDAVRMLEPDRFEVRAGDCVLVVQIVDEPGGHGEGWVGPRRFAAVPGVPACP